MATILPKPDSLYDSLSGPEYIRCPLCDGTGQYDGDDPSGIHEHCCGQCQGWGWVNAQSHDATCIHAWEEIPNRTEHDDICSFSCPKCGTTEDVVFPR
jgi:hypothetical protein